MKIKNIDGRTYLFADEYKVVTDGVDIYGKEIALEIGRTEEGFYEISQEEYDEILRAQEDEEFA